MFFITSGPDVISLAQSQVVEDYGVGFARDLAVAPRRNILQ